jgi:hypothetical protein
VASDYDVNGKFTLIHVNLEPARLARQLSALSILGTIRIGRRR